MRKKGPTPNSQRRLKMYNEFGIKNEILELAKEVEKEIQPQFEKLII